MKAIVGMFVVAWVAISVPLAGWSFGKLALHEQMHWYNWASIGTVGLGFFVACYAVASSILEDLEDMS